MRRTKLGLAKGREGVAKALEVRVHPRAKRNSVEVGEEGRLEVYVTAAPEDGAANDEVVRLVAEKFGVSQSSVRIVRGHKGHDKLLRSEG